MPRLTLPIRPDGPVVGLSVPVTAAYARRLRQALRPVPQPVEMEAVLDTGSPVTCIDRESFAGLRKIRRGTNQGPVSARVLPPICAASPAWGSGPYPFPIGTEPAGRSPSARPHRP